MCLHVLLISKQLDRDGKGDLQSLLHEYSSCIVTGYYFDYKPPEGTHFESQTGRSF